MIRYWLVILSLSFACATSGQEPGTHAWLDSIARVQPVDLPENGWHFSHPELLQGDTFRVRIYPESDPGFFWIIDDSGHTRYDSIAQSRIPAADPDPAIWSSYELTGRIIPASLHFLSGIAAGSRYVLLNRYSDFKGRHLGLADTWWDPQQSRNGYNALGVAQYTFLTAGIVLDLNARAHWSHYLLDAALYTLVRQGGYHLAQKFYP